MGLLHWFNMSNIFLTKYNNTSSIGINASLFRSFRLDITILYVYNKHTLKYIYIYIYIYIERERKKDACWMVFAVIDRKWIWDINNLLNCLRGIFVFFGPSCRTISSIRKRRLRSQKVRRSSWNCQGKITKRFLFLWSKTRVRSGRGSK